MTERNLEHFPAEEPENEAEVTKKGGGKHKPNNDQIRKPAEEELMENQEVDEERKELLKEFEGSDEHETVAQVTKNLIPQKEQELRRLEEEINKKSKALIFFNVSAFLFSEARETKKMALQELEDLKHKAETAREELRIFNQRLKDLQA